MRLLDATLYSFALEGVPTPSFCLCLLAQLAVSVSLNTFSALSKAFHAFVCASGW